MGMPGAGWSRPRITAKNYEQAWKQTAYYQRTKGGRLLGPISGIPASLALSPLIWPQTYAARVLTKKSWIIWISASGLGYSTRPGVTTGSPCSSCSIMRQLAGPRDAQLTLA